MRRRRRIKKSKINSLSRASSLPPPRAVSGPKVPSERSGTVFRRWKKNAIDPTTLPVPRTSPRNGRQRPPTPTQVHILTQTTPKTIDTKVNTKGVLKNIKNIQRNVITQKSQRKSGHQTKSPSHSDIKEAIKQDLRRRISSLPIPCRPLSPVITMGLRELGRELKIRLASRTPELRETHIDRGRCLVRLNHTGYRNVPLYDIDSKKQEGTLSTYVNVKLMAKDMKYK